MLFAREILKEIQKILPREEFVILTGARQTGKTSLLILIKNFLEHKSEPCFYFNLENPNYLNPLNEHAFNIFDFLPNSKVKMNIFIDEIQYLNDPTNFLKLLYDEKRTKVKIIASGSSSFYIDKKFKDSLSGRKFLFEIYPLNFCEFVHFNKQDDVLKQDLKKLSAYYKEKLDILWREYLIYGGYPKVVLEKDTDIKKILIDEIGSSYIKKDIQDAGIKNTDVYFALLKVFAEQTGKLVNAQELSNTFKISHKTVEDYMYIMKKSYHAAFINPFYKNFRKELTKMPKVYFYDLGLRNFFLNNYKSISKRSDKGQYLENIAFREFLRKTKQCDNIKFWRTQDKKEVDFVIGKQAYEMKFTLNTLREKRYEQFKNTYPDIGLSFLTYDDLLEKFYFSQTNPLN